MTLERQRALVSGGHMAYADLGQGPPVVLLHGFPTSADLWDYEAPLLSAQMRVIVPDLIGYGDSDRPAGADISPAAQAGYVRELVTGLGIDGYAVVGHGLGGGVAQILATEGDVRVLVLLDSMAFDRGHPSEPPAREMETAVRQWFSSSISHPEYVPPRTLEGFIRAWLGDPASFARAAEASRTADLPTDRALSAVDAPAFVVWGEEDTLFPPSLAERLGDAMPGSTVALLPGCSHLVHLDAPQTVGPLMFEFLRARYVGRPREHAAGTRPVAVLFERPTDPQLLEPDLDGEDP